MNTKKIGFSAGIAGAAFLGYLMLGGQYVPPTQNVQPGAPMRASGDPNGVRSAPIYSQYTDSSNGVIYQNLSGGTTWDPIWIPATAGVLVSSDIIDNNFTSTTIGSATASAPAEASRPGMRSYSMSAAGADGGAVHVGITRTVLLGTGAARFRMSARITTLSDGSNNIIVRLGSHGVTTVADVTNGVYYEYDFATHSNHNWWLCTADNGSRTKTDTGILAVASSTTPQRFVITVNAAGTSVSGTINGVAVAAAVIANIPTAAARQISACSWLAYKQAGAGALVAAIDWCDFYTIFTTPRSI